VLEVERQPRRALLDSEVGVEDVSPAIRDRDGHRSKLVTAGGIGTPQVEGDHSIASVALTDAPELTLAPLQLVLHVTCGLDHSLEGRHPGKGDNAHPKRKPIPHPRELLVPELGRSIDTHRCGIERQEYSEADRAQLQRNDGMVDAEGAGVVADAAHPDRALSPLVISQGDLGALESPRRFVGAQGPRQVRRRDEAAEVSAVEQVELSREIMREARQFETQKLLVVAAREVVDHLLDNESNGVAELETFIGKPVRFQVEPSYTPEQYDVVLL